MPQSTRQAAVISTDISGFTRLSREIGSDEMVELLNVYFALVDGAVTQHGGEVIQHVGDCVIAIFGGGLEAAAARAAQSALTMHRAISTVPSPTGTGDFLGIHIGISYGTVTIEGTSGKRTLLGQTAKDAEELQSLAHNTQTALSSEIRHALGPAFEAQTGGHTAANDEWFVLDASDVPDLDIEMLAGAFTRAVDTAEGEKRQVTVLFAAASGPQGAPLPRATLQQWHRLAVAAVDDRRGTVDKLIGPCVMALFGAPIAHSNDHYRALEMAFYLVEAVRRRLAEHGATVRVGIASGQVVASVTGSRAFTEYTVTGDSVNLASRLLSRAQENQVIISDAVCRALRSQVRCDDLGELSIKGFEKTVRAWRADGFVDPSLLAEATGFVGRLPIINDFREYLAGPMAQTGLALYVRGEAGVGKSALMDQLQRLAQAAGYQCHRGVALDFGAGAGPSAVGMMARSLIGASAAGQDDVAVERALQDAIGSNLVDRDDESHLRAMVRLPQPPGLRALYDAMGNEARIAGGARMITTLVQRLSERSPLLLRLEDLHWASDLAVGQFTAIAALVPQCRIVLLTTSRIDNCPLGSGRIDADLKYTLIELKPLSEGEAHQLASRHPTLTRRFLGRCIERAEGNPLFLQQLLDRGERDESEEIPGSVHSIVLAKMDRLPKDHRNALQAAAVLGDHFELQTVNALIDDAQPDLDVLLSNRLIRPTATGFRFAHALIRDSVYSSLLKRQRHLLHYRAACAFEGRDLVLRAEHLDRAELPDAPAAYIEAARAQSAAYHAATAIRLLERAQALSTTDETLREATLTLGDIVRDLGQIERALAEYNATLALEPDAESQCRARIGRAACMRVSDELSRALTELDVAQGFADAIGDPTLLAEIHYYRGNLFFPLGRIEECLWEHQTSLGHARAVGSARAEALALSGLGDAHYARGRMSSAHPFFRRCLALCREHDLGRIESANSFMVGTVRIYLNELDGALDDSLYSAELARKVGNQRAEIVSRLTAGWILIMQQRLDEAREQVFTGLAIVESLGAKRFDPFLRESLARILYYEGRREEAVAEAERAMEAVRQGSMRFIGPWVSSTLALVTSDAEVREAALREGLDVLRDGAVGHNYFNFYVQAMEASLNAADWEGALRFADALEAYTRAEALPWSDFFIQRARALVAFQRSPDDAARGRVTALEEHARKVKLEVACPLLRAAQTQ